jgi:hypothetical protein
VRKGQGARGRGRCVRKVINTVFENRGGKLAGVLVQRVSQVGRGSGSGVGGDGHHQEPGLTERVTVGRKGQSSLGFNTQPLVM